VVSDTVWIHVSRSTPCPACGKSDWCKLDANGSVAFCRRSPEGPLGTGREYTDAKGEPFWIHYLEPGAEPRELPEVSKPGAEPPPAAEPEVLNRVYRVLLAELALDAPHRENLLARGLSSADVEAGLFHTWPLRGRSRLAKKLVEQFGEEVARQVPGLFVKADESDSSRTWWSLAGSPGLLIPALDVTGRVLGLRVRRDEVDADSGRYSWVSSYRHGGPKPATSLHVPPGPRGRLVRLTEGELKATVATVQTGVLTVGVAGVGRWQEALPVLAELEAERVLLAFDSDCREKPHVARATRSAVRGLQEAGFEVAVETWPAEAGKGVDDALQAGAELEVLEAEALEQFLAELEAVAPVSRGNVVPLRRRADAPATSGALALAPGAVALKGHQFERTDPGQAEYLLALAEDTLRHCAPMRYPWLVWSGKHWQQDKTNLVHELAIKAARQRLRDAVEIQDTDRQKAEVGFSLGCQSASRRRAVVDTAAVFQAINVLPEALDANPWVLNVQNGTLCLRTGELRPHRREDYLTRVAPVPYDASATCPLWERFLARVMADNADVIGYLQRAAGYCLTGSTAEEVFFLLHGPGRNGKGVFVETLAALLGDLAEKVPVDLLCDSRRNADAPSPHLAKLPGVRLVHTSEAEENRRLGEAFVKEVTGGDTISAAAKFQDPIQFRPQFKLLFSTNHRPDIRGTDEGIWSRVHLVPFSVTIPPHERDKHLKQKLLAELPGILAWAVRGCLAWQRVGLNPPAEVLAATASYRAESDVLGAFLADCTTTEPPPVADGELFSREVRATVKELRNAYQAWCLENGERPISSAAFGRSLDERGFPSRKGAKNVSYRLGIRLFTAAELEAAPPPEPSEETPEERGGLPGLPGLPDFQEVSEFVSHEGLSENRVTQVTQVTHEEELVEELL